MTEEVDQNLLVAKNWLWTIDHGLWNYSKSSPAGSDKNYVRLTV